MAKRKPPAHYPAPDILDIIDDVADRAAGLFENFLFGAADRLKAQARGYGQPGTRENTPPRGNKHVPGDRPPPRGKTTTTPREPVQRTAYRVLGLTPRVEQEVIKAVYLALAKKYHPDVNKGAKAVERMKDINAAWEVLKDPQTRAEYDRSMGLDR